MLHIDQLCVLDAGLQNGEFQDVVRLLVEHEVARVNRFAEFVFAHTRFKFGLDGLQIHVESVKYVGDGFVPLAQNTEQQVLRPYRPTGQSGGFFATECENLRYFG